MADLSPRFPGDMPDMPDKPPRHQRHVGRVGADTGSTLPLSHLWVDLGVRPPRPLKTPAFPPNDGGWGIRPTRGPRRVAPAGHGTHADQSTAGLVPCRLAGGGGTFRWRGSRAVGAPWPGAHNPVASRAAGVSAQISGAGASGRGTRQCEYVHPFAPRKIFCE